MNQPEAQNNTPLSPSYRGDFHLHTHLSPDSFMSPRARVHAADRAGIDCLAVTDHNTIRGAAGAAILNAELLYRKELIG